MNVMQHIRRLEAAGFRGETLDRAVALAGANRLAYASLCSAVEDRGLTPAEALQLIGRADRI